MPMSDHQYFSSNERISKVQVYGVNNLRPADGITCSDWFFPRTDHDRRLIPGQTDRGSPRQPYHAFSHLSGFSSLGLLGASDTPRPSQPHYLPAVV